MAKQEKYLPLFWADAAAKGGWGEIADKVGIDTLREIGNDVTDDRDTALKLIYSHQPLQNLLCSYAEIAETSKLGDMNAVYETISDADNMSIILSWSKNKQVYAFDADFLDELLRTDIIAMSKDMLDYLPHEYMYIDISANKELCKRLCAEGFFVTVTKGFFDDDKTSFYALHICKVTREYIFNDVFLIPNVDGKINTKEIEVEDNNHVRLYEPENDGYKVKTVESNRTEETNLMFQILAYLASVEPEIEENPGTARTYRKPTEGFKPKNKFSEIRKWDVGVRFGSAIRRWKSSKSTGTGTGTKQRPHSRSAHWSHYWYNKTDEHGNVILDKSGNPEKIRRAKWVSEYYVGMKDKNDPAVIHRVRKEG